MIVTKKLTTPHIPVYSWYEEDPELLEFEKECFIRFRKDYNCPDMRIQMGFDKDHRLCVRIRFPFRAEPKLPRDMWEFLVVYDNDHPSMDCNGMYGGSIKIYPLVPVDRKFHHLIGRNTDKPYLCQSKEAETEKVNGYYAMKRVMRWLMVYYVWKQTGVDVDM